MEYVYGTLYGLLVAFVVGWIMYNACAGSKKDRLQTAILWGVGMGIISTLCVFGG